MSSITLDKNRMNLLACVSVCDRERGKRIVGVFAVLVAANILIIHTH